MSWIAEGNKNYTLGRGKLHFIPASNANQDEYRYLGNSVEFNINTEVEELDHYNADTGTRLKDGTASLEVTRAGSLTLDNASIENLALFFMGTAAQVAQAAAANQSENFTVASPEAVFQLGVTTALPMGVTNVSGVTVETNPSGTTYVAGTDYIADLENGAVELISGGGIAAAQAITISYSVDAGTYVQIIPGTVPIQGKLLYTSFNSEGLQVRHLWPRAKLTPNGDLALKGDEWQQLPFTFEALVPETGGASHYVQRPAT